MQYGITENSGLVPASFVTLLDEDPIRITSQDLREFIIEFPDRSVHYLYRGLDEEKRPAWYFQTADNADLADAIGKIIERHFT
ncbi:MAG: hypothetical protein P4L51_08340 [Puia sp.]|nr:hypothetical protein [Puia sp.]